MRHFHYSAVTHRGELVRGSLEALDLAELDATLRARSLTLYRAMEVPRWVEGLRRRRLNKRLTAEFCYYLSEYIRAGADLRLALLDMTESAPSPRVRTFSKAVLARVERGDPLSIALRETKALPPLVVNLVRVGEETGRIDTVLAGAARHYEQLVQVGASLSRALVYPGIALTLLLAALGFWVGYVLPRLAALFLTLMPQLPPSTRAVLDSAAWLRAHWPWLAMAFVLLGLGLPVLLGRRSMRPLADRIRWYLPLLWRLERARTYFIFFSNLAVMYGTGMTLTRALDVLLADPPNRVFGDRLSRLSERLRQGSSLRQAMTASGGFEPVAIGMVRLGESTGSLDQQSARLGAYYQEKLRTGTDTLVRLFEPMVLLLLSLMLILMVITVLAPVYDLAQLTAARIKR